MSPNHFRVTAKQEISLKESDKKVSKMNRQGLRSTCPWDYDPSADDWAPSTRVKSERQRKREAELDERKLMNEKEAAERRRKIIGNRLKSNISFNDEPENLNIHPSTRRSDRNRSTIFQSDEKPKSNTRKMVDSPRKRAEYDIITGAPNAAPLVNEGDLEIDDLIDSFTPVGDSDPLVCQNCDNKKVMMEKERRQQEEKEREIMERKKMEEENVQEMEEKKKQEAERKEVAKKEWAEFFEVSEQRRKMEHDEMMRKEIEERERNEQKAKQEEEEEARKKMTNQKKSTFLEGLREQIQMKERKIQEEGGKGTGETGLPFNEPTIEQKKMMIQKRKQDMIAMLSAELTAKQKNEERRRELATVEENRRREVEKAEEDKEKKRDEETKERGRKWGVAVSRQLQMDRERKERDIQEERQHERELLTQGFWKDTAPTQSKLQCTECTELNPPSSYLGSPTNSSALKRNLDSILISRGRSPGSPSRDPELRPVSAPTF